MEKEGVSYEPIWGSCIWRNLIEEVDLKLVAWDAKLRDLAKTMTLGTQPGY